MFRGGVALASPKGVAPEAAAEMVSSYTWASQLQLRVSRYIVPLSEPVNDLINFTTLHDRESNSALGAVLLDSPPYARLWWHGGAMTSCSEQVPCHRFDVPFCMYDASDLSCSLPTWALEHYHDNCLSTPSGRAGGDEKPSHTPKRQRPSELQ